MSMNKFGFEVENPRANNTSSQPKSM